MAGSYTVSGAVVEQRRAAATVHGVRSDAHVRDVARAQKRRILRRLGMRASDLDAISAVFVDVLARSLAKVVMLDAYYAERGIVRSDGQGEPTLAIYMSALNQAGLTAVKLAEHMSRQGVTGDDLHDYIDAEYRQSTLLLGYVRTLVERSPLLRSQLVSARDDRLTFKGNRVLVAAPCQDRADPRCVGVGVGVR
jgi:hypothetical protein